MEKPGLCSGSASVLLTIGLVAAPAMAAFGQGCTEQVARDFLAGWSHNTPKLVSIFADDFTYEDTTVHAVLHKKEELRTFADGWFKAFPDLSFTFKNAVVSPDRVAVQWEVTGTQNGDMPGMPASHKVMNSVGVTVLDCADGKVKQVADYYDMSNVMRQLGFLPATK